MFGAYHHFANPVSYNTIDNTQLRGMMARRKKGESAPVPIIKEFHLDFLHPSQELAWRQYQRHDILFLLGPAGTGKAQPLDSTVYTPTGPKRMRDITPGDEVCTPDGGTSHVLAIYPQGVKDVFRVFFKHGDSVECCGEHLWKVNSRQRQWLSEKIVDTEYIEDNARTPKGRRNLHIAMSKPVTFEEQPVLIEPYLLGVLLGDDAMSCGSLGFSTSDDEIVCSVSQLLDEGYYCYKKRLSEYDYIITTDRRELNRYRKALEELGLWGCRSWEKVIPEAYIFNSTEVRWSLLQGLMDTGGMIEKGGFAYLSTTSKGFANAFKVLVQSLGMDCKITPKTKSYTYNGEKKAGKSSFYCSVYCDEPHQLFRLDRKKSVYHSRSKYFVKKIIDRVERVGQKRCQCILTDHHDHMYLTDNFVPTHNTHLATGFAIHDILQKKKDRIVVTRPVVESGESLGYLPGDFHEKILPYMMPIYDCVNKIVGRNSVDKEKIQASLEIVPINYMRGRTFDSSVFILDEAQNCTYDQIKLAISRLGFNSKMVITGDPDQSDLSGEVALESIVAKIGSLSGVATMRFKDGDIVRHSLIARILRRL